MLRKLLSLNFSLVYVISIFRLCGIAIMLLSVSKNINISSISTISFRNYRPYKDKYITDVLYRKILSIIMSHQSYHNFSCFLKILDTIS